MDSVGSVKARSAGLGRMANEILGCSWNSIGSLLLVAQSGALRAETWAGMSHMTRIPSRHVPRILHINMFVICLLTTFAHLFQFQHAENNMCPTCGLDMNQHALGCHSNLFVLSQAVMNLCHLTKRRLLGLAGPQQLPFVT